MNQNINRSSNPKSRNPMNDLPVETSGSSAVKFCTIDPMIIRGMPKIIKQTDARHEMMAGISLGGALRNGIL